MKIEGSGRGGSMRAHIDFILKEEGEEGLERLENTMVELGHPINYRELKAMEPFPLRLEAITLLAIKRIFDYDDKKLQEMGEFVVKFSIIIKLFMKYFISLEKLLKVGPSMWRKGGTMGDLIIAEYDKESRHAVIRIANYRTHPVYCPIFRGYFLGAIKMIVKGEPTIEETKCIYRGDEYHEFVLRW
jgi:hypothetical protein